MKILKEVARPIIAVLIAVLVLLLTIIELPAALLAIYHLVQPPLGFNASESTTINVTRSATEALSTFNTPSFDLVFANGILLATSVLALIGIYTAYTMIRAMQRDIVSSLTIGWVDESGIVKIKNTSSELIRFDVTVNYFSDCDINHEKADCTWKDKTKRIYVERSFEMNNRAKWIRYKDFHIAPSTEEPIRLNNLASKKTYVSLSLVVTYINTYTTRWHMLVPDLPKYVRTRYVVYRYAGAISTNNQYYHPHKKSNCSTMVERKTLYTVIMQLTSKRAERPAGAAVAGMKYHKDKK